MTRKYIWADNTAINYLDLPYRQSYKDWVGYYEFPVDRFSVASGLLELDCISLLPKPSYNLTGLSGINWKDRYFDIMDCIADTVFETANGRHIHLLYSGGTDSTGVYCALKRSKHFRSYQERGCISVSLTSMSINEYPRLFYSEILPEMNLVPLNYNDLMSDPNILLVTGEPGDYIIGNADATSLEINLMEHYSKFYEISNSKLRLFMDLCELSRPHCPFDIESVNQYVWWINQCYSYHEPLIKPYIWSSTDDYSKLFTNSKVFNFFNDDLMTAFSYEYMSTNPRYEHADDLKNFIKEYTCNYTKDTDYLTKPKVYSQRLSLRSLYKNVIYLEDGVIKDDFISGSLT